MKKTLESFKSEVQRLMPEGLSDKAKEDVDWAATQLWELDDNCSVYDARNFALCLDSVNPDLAPEVSVATMERALNRYKFAC